MGLEESLKDAKQTLRVNQDDPSICRFSKPSLRSLKDDKFFLGLN